MDFKTKKPSIPASGQTSLSHSIARPLDDAGRLSKVLGMPEGISALVLDEYQPGEVEIVNIEAKRPGNGFGSMAMNQICAAADRQGITLMLIPAGEGRKAKRLRSFYSQFGFEEDGDVMRREARNDGF